MSLLHRTSSGLAWGQAGRVAEVALGLAFSIFVVRQLGNEGYGTYALLFSLVGFASVICSLGLNEAISKYLPTATVQGSEGQVSYIFRAVIIYRLIATVVGSVVLYSLCGILADVFQSKAISEYAYLIVAVFALQNMTDLLAAFYISYLRVKTYYAVRLISQALSLASVLVFFGLWGTSAVLALAAVLFSTSVAGLLYLAGARTELQQPPRETDLAPVRRFALTVWLINLLTFGLGFQIDTLFIGYFLKDKAEIAYYNVAALVMFRLFLVLGGWTIVILPSLSESFAKGGKERLASVCDLYFKLHLALYLPVVAFVGLRSEGLITLVFGNSYQASAPLLTVYALLNIAAVYALGGSALPVLYAAGGEKFVVWLRILSGGLNIVLDVLFIPPWGAMGAVIATTSSVFVGSVSELILTRHVASINYPAGFALKLSLAVGLALLAVAWLPSSGWSTLVASGILYAAALASALYLLKPLGAKDKEVAILTNRHIGFLARYF